MRGYCGTFSQDGEYLYRVDVDGHKPGGWKNKDYALHAAAQYAFLAWPAASVACDAHRGSEEQECILSCPVLVWRRLLYKLHQKLLLPLRDAKAERQWLFLLGIDELDKLQRDACEAQRDVPSGPGAPMSPGPTCVAL